MEEDTSRCSGPVVATFCLSINMAVPDLSGSGRGDLVTCRKAKDPTKNRSDSRKATGALYVSKRLNKSTGTGKIMVELFSADTSTRLCRNLRCKAIGCFPMTSAASASFCEA